MAETEIVHPAELHWYMIPFGNRYELLSRRTTMPNKLLEAGIFYLGFMDADQAKLAAIKKAKDMVRQSHSINKVQSLCERGI